MGMGAPKPKFHKRTRRSFPLTSEINVTPFVDVMLVLLVIFMITAPLMTTGLQINLPQAKAPSLSEPIEPLTITIDKDKQIYIQESLIPLDNLTEKLRVLTNNNPEARLYVRGDTSLSYGDIMLVMAHIGNAGYTRVALLTDMPKPNSRPSKSKPSAFKSKAER